MLVSVEPDTFARIEPGDGRIRIRFDETLSEQVQGGTLDDVVQVSPRTGAVKVSQSGQELEVEIEGGFQPDVVYRVTVLPKLTDRFSNALLAPFEWVFSTGPDFEPTALAGEVWDRVTGEPIPDAWVTALDDDSVAYVAVTDTAGIFAMRYLPSGRYSIGGLLDRDRDRIADAFEAQGSAPDIRLGRADTLLTSFALLVPDTTPPRLVQGEKLDSAVLRIIFDDPLDPALSLDGFIRGMYRDSGNTPGVLRVLQEWDYEVWSDSIAAERSAAAEAAEGAAGAEAGAAEGREAALPDSLEIQPGGLQTGDTLAAEGDTVAEAEAAERGEEQFLPNGERIPRNSLVLLLRGVIEGGDIYTVVHGAVRNISGLETEEGEGEIRLAADPEPPAADTLAADSLAADSLAADTLAADTLAADSVAGAVPPDSVRPDSIRPDTVRAGRVPPDSVAADTMQAGRRERRRR